MNDFNIYGCYPREYSPEDFKISDYTDIGLYCDTDSLPFGSVKVVIPEVEISPAGAPVFDYSSVITDCLSIDQEENGQKIFVPVGGRNTLPLNHDIYFYFDETCEDEVAHVKLDRLFYSNEAFYFSQRKKKVITKILIVNLTELLNTAKA